MYGLIVSAGILIAAWFAEKLFKAENKDPELLWNAIYTILIFGIVGARSLHVFHLWSFYLENPIQILQIWKGGLSILGAIAGGLLGLILFSFKVKLNKSEVLQILDIAAISLPIGQAIGRWANFFNEELYGKPTDLPWGIYIPPYKRTYETYFFDSFHPLFLYESIGSLIIFLALLTIKFKFNSKLKLLDGDLFLIYLVSYCTLRISLENFRLNSWEINSISVNSAICLATIVLSMSFYLAKRIQKL